MTYAPEHGKELLDRSIRCRMGVSGGPCSGSKQARTAENSWHPRGPQRRLFYVLKSGCPRRLLPKDFTPWGTVYWWFGRWRADGTFERLNAALREQLRSRLGRNPLPSAGIADSQSSKTTRVSGEQRGGTTGTRRFGAGNSTYWWIPKGWFSKPRYEATALGVVSPQRAHRRQPLPASALGVLGDRGGAEPRVQSRSLPAVVVFYPGDLYQLRMHPRQVVVLQEILADELVVRCDFVPLLSHHPPLVQPVVCETLGQVAELLGERSGVQVEVDEDEEAPALYPDGQEAVVSFVEFANLAHVEGGLGILGDVRALEERRAQAFALEVVSPTVVGAPYPVVACHAGAVVEQLGSPMATDVVEGLELTLLVPGNDDRTSGHLGDDHLPGLLYLRSEPHNDPTRCEHLLPLDLEELASGVGVGDEGHR